MDHKTTDNYAPEHKRTVAWNDAAIGIDWPVDGGLVLSARIGSGQRRALGLAGVCA
jgi:dTDP-4-dehydrorhamnose 3,5-epimerase